MNFTARLATDRRCSSRNFVCGIKKNFRLCREMASCSYSRFNPWAKNASPDTEESLFSIDLRNVAHMFSFSPLVLGKARNGRDTMEPSDPPSKFLLAFTSPQRWLCFWFHRPAGPCRTSPGEASLLPLDPRGGGGPWTLWIRNAGCRACLRGRGLLWKFASPQEQGVVGGAWRPSCASLHAFLTLPLFFLLSHADLCCEKHLSGLSFFCPLSWRDKRGSDPLCEIRA